MHVSRRWLLAAAPVMALAATAAAADTTDLAVSCDLAAVPAVAGAARAFRARSGIRVRIFPTPGGLLIPQLQRDIQNDIVVTRPALLDRAEQAGLVAPGGRTALWRNRLVVAEPAQPTGAANTFAVPDPTPAADFDGAEVLHRMGSPPVQIVGVIDTEAVAWMLRHGGARQGLLHQTEVTADARLRTVAPVPDSAWPPILYTATVTRLASRPDPGAFTAFLGSADGMAAFRSAGLERVT